MLQLSPPFVAGGSSSHQRIECSARCFFTSRTSTISMVPHPAPTLRSHIPLPTLRSQKIRRSHQSSARRRLGLGVCLASAHTLILTPQRPAVENPETNLVLAGTSRAERTAGNGQIRSGSQRRTARRAASSTDRAICQGAVVAWPAGVLPDTGISSVANAGTENALMGAPRLFVPLPRPKPKPRRGRSVPRMFSRTGPRTKTGSCSPNRHTTRLVRAEGKAEGEPGPEQPWPSPTSNGRSSALSRQSSLPQRHAPSPSACVQRAMWPGGARPVPRRRCKTI